MANLEQAVESPHVEEAPEAPTVEIPAEPSQGTGELDAARDAVMDAMNSSTPQAPEPIQALNAQPVDLNLGPTPSVGGVEAGDAASDEAAAEAAQESPLPIGLPEGVEVVEPVDDAADEAVIITPTDPATPPPPPVPPPMVPPLMPPTEGTDPSKPAVSAL